ncbi:MAG TPA: DNA polymerase III subunit delta [Gemmatimonadaceae bacterium]
MAAADDRALTKALRSGSFAHAYALFGDDDFLKEQALRELIAAAVDPATRDFNLDVRSGAELSAETLGSLVGTPPMMAERRVVVVRDAGALKKDARAVLDAHLARAPKGAVDIVLVLVYPSGEKGKPDKSVLDRAFAVDFAPLDAKRVPRWIAHHASAVLGATITPEAADLLQRAVGNDLAALAAELDKLASYASGAPIDESAVAAVVGVRRGETLGDFLDTVAGRDARAALALLPHILEQPKTTAVSVVMALTTQMLALSWGRGMRDRGVPAARLDFFGFLKGGGGAYTGRPWGDAAKAWARYVDEWDAPALDAALESLLAADIALKETRVSSDEQLLSTLVLALCASGAASGTGTPPGRRGAAA